MESDCAALAPHWLIKRVASEGDYQKFEEFLLRSFVEDNRWVIYYCSDCFLLSVATALKNYCSDCF